jgi:hypothetical protein
MTSPITSPMTRTGNVSRRSAMRRNLIPALPERSAAFFLKSLAPCADARSRAADGQFQRPDPHRQTGSPRRSNTRAAIPHSPDHRHPAWRAASKRQSPVPGQSGAMAGAARQRSCRLPLELICDLTTRRTHQTASHSHRSLSMVSPISREVKAGNPL